MIENKTLIFGATRGIGKIVTRHLKKNGHKIIQFSRNKSKKNHNIQIDLSNLNEISETLNQSLSKKEKIKNIIFSQRHRGNDFNENFNVSLFSIVKVIESLKNKLINGASIVIIQSQARKYVLNDHDIDYHLIHSALDSLTRFYAVKFGKKSIRVNSVSTVAIKKPENKKFYTKNNEIQKLIKKITPLNKMGDAKDVADVVNFLCSKKSSFVTGQTIAVNGGIDLYSHETIAKKIFFNS